MSDLKSLNDYSVCYRSHYSKSSECTYVNHFIAINVTPKIIRLKRILYFITFSWTQLMYQIVFEFNSLNFNSKFYCFDFAVISVFLMSYGDVCD